MLDVLIRTCYLTPINKSGYRIKYLIFKIIFGMKIFNKTSYFFLVTVVFLTSFSLSSCRKSEAFNQNDNIRILSKEAFYKDVENLAPALVKMIESFKKQKIFEENIPEFIKKNGLPVWNHTLYKVKNQKGIYSGYSQGIRTNKYINEKIINGRPRTRVVLCSFAVSGKW